MISDEFHIYNTSNLKCAYVRWKANGQITSFKNLLNKCPTDFQMRTLGKNSAYYIVLPKWPLFVEIYRVSLVIQFNCQDYCDFSSLKNFQSFA